MIPALVAVVLTTPYAWMPRLCPDVKVVVFRHHPGLIAAEEVMEGRRQDEKTIKKALRGGELGYTYQGGLGSGYELSIRADDLPEWKKLIDGLIKTKALTAYNTWGLNGQGLGLVRIP